MVKAAIIVGIQMIVAVLSCLQQDIPWTKRVGKIAFRVGKSRYNRWNSNDCSGFILSSTRYTMDKKSW